MATELLGAIKYTNRKVAHEVRHDLESFAWVLAYVLSRSFSKQRELPTEQRTRLKKHFARSFGLHSVYDIYTSRRSCEPLDTDVYEDLLPKPMVILLFKLWRAVHAHFALEFAEAEEEMKPLTHDLVLGLFNAAHHSL